MLTARENLIQTVRGGSPDRFVNQYEALRLLMNPYIVRSPTPAPGEMNVKNAWGVINSFPKGAPGVYPEHSPDKVVVKDIEDWREYVHSPALKFSPEIWDEMRAKYEAVDASKSFRAAYVFPGLFEHTHHMCSMTEALVYYMTNPDEMHDFIAYLTDWELELAEGICSNLHPDAVFHHDDWGSETSTFFRPDMFAEFFVEPYKKIYKYYHDHGVELVFHHSDSYAATLVPYMIEMGIDVWQGVMRSNDIGSLIAKYGGQISFMGGIDNKQVDFEDWTREDCRRAARSACDEFGMKYFIPCITQGGPGSVYPGAYEMLWEEIDRYNLERFGVCSDESSRLPMQLV